MGTVPRRWTVATWLVAGVGDQTEALAGVLAELHADVIALQSLRERETDALAAALSLDSAWEKSHHPRGRLFRASALGLAVLTPHALADSTSVTITEQRSSWSRKRRIAQIALVERDDHTGYSIAHAVGSISTRMFDTTTIGGRSPAPTVRVHPAQVGVDDRRVFELPDGATLVSAATSTPLDDAPPLAQATFDMAWVDGDLPTG